MHDFRGMVRAGDYNPPKNNTSFEGDFLYLPKDEVLRGKIVQRYSNYNGLIIYEWLSAMKASGLWDKVVQKRKKIAQRFDKEHKIAFDKSDGHAYYPTLGKEEFKKDIEFLIGKKIKPGCLLNEDVQGELVRGINHYV